MREWWTTQMWEDRYYNCGKEREKPRYEVGIEWDRKNSYDNWIRDDRAKEIIAWCKARDPEGFLCFYGSFIFKDLDAAMLFYLTFQKPA